MIKIRNIIAAAALAIAVTPGVVTQASAQVAPAARNSAIVAQDSSMRASKLIGMMVYNDKGERLGKIVDIMVMATATEPTVVLSTASTPSKMVAIPLSHINLNNDKASMEGTRPEVAAMPSWSFNGRISGGG